MARPRLARGMTARLAVLRLASTYQASNVQRFSPAPGQHGHARAFDRISGHVSMGQNGSPGLECAVKTFPHALLSSRRHSAATSATDHGPIVFRPVPFGPHFRLLLPAHAPIIPGREGDRHCIARFRGVDSDESASLSCPTTRPPV